MKKPTAADIAREFALAAVKEKKYPRCILCKMPQEIQGAIPICLESDPPMSYAELARQIASRTGTVLHPQSIQKHYRDHMKKAA